MEIEKFNEGTIQALGYYVYMLMEPSNQKPFYIGKGSGNRVFKHLNLEDTEDADDNLKFDKIKEITKRGEAVDHVIVRHGLNESEALMVEAALIDSFSYCQFESANKIRGHNSDDYGLMTTEEIKRLYQAEPLTGIGEDCVIININKKYRRGDGVEGIYEATKEAWVISKERLKSTKYVLSEYQGVIVEVFEVHEWYETERPDEEKAREQSGNKTRYGFRGRRAEENVRNQYINKSIAHAKKQGSANPVRFNL